MNKVQQQPLIAKKRKRKILMKHCLICKTFFKKFLLSFYTQNWLHFMFVAAHDVVKGRREIEDHASIFISHQLRLFCW